MDVRFFLRLSLGLFALLAATAPAQGAPGRPLTACVARVQRGDTPAAMFASPARFDCTTPQNRFGSGDFWIVAALHPGSGTGTGNIRSASLWQDRLDLWVRFADGSTDHQFATSATAHEHLRLGAAIEFHLPPRAAPPVQVLWRVRGSPNVRGILLGARLMGHGDTANLEILLAGLYGGFGGMCCALFVYNLALWGALRQRFQPTYCLMLLCLLAYAFSSSGALGQVTGIDNNLRLRINAVLLAASAGSAALFARTFFEARVFAGWLRPASSAILSFLALSVGAHALLAPWQFLLLDRLMSLAYLLVIALAPLILWRAWRCRSAYLSLFALAWGVPVVLAGVRLAAAVDLIGWSFFTDNSTLLSMALEALLSSLAVSYRIRLLSRERDEAREQEIAARLLADTDPLTGLLNRRAFLRQAIGRAGEQSLLLVDIDHFKQVNETIGHDGGDEVLRLVARELRAASPGEALVARLGGEEFAILTAAHRAPDAEDLLARMRAARMPFDLCVTASIGRCTGALLADTDWKALYHHADRALFAAKKAGRDRARTAAQGRAPASLVAAA